MGTTFTLADGFDQTDVRTTSGSWDQTYSTVTANSSTWSTVTAVSGGIALVGTTVHLADPETLTQIAEADAVAADRMLIWDESVSTWKYITVEDLQDEIDTTGGGGGGGISFDGSTANGVCTYKDSDEATVESNLTFDGTDLFVANKITHLSDTDTYINFTDDDINVQAGGVNMIDFTQDTVSDITINEAAQDLDVRIEGEADPNLFFTDGSTSKVGIGTNVPAEKLTVAGTLSSQGLASVFGVHTTVHDYGTTANIDVDFDYASLQKVTLNGAPAIDTNAANKGAGKSIVIKILCDGSARAFTWNSSWIFIGEKPTSIAASKTALLSMTCFGTSESDVICSYAVQD